VTVQVADRANWLDKNLKFAGSFDHCPITHLRGECLKSHDVLKTRFFRDEYRRVTDEGQGVFDICKRNQMMGIKKVRVLFCWPKRI